MSKLNIPESWAETGLKVTAEINMGQSPEGNTVSESSSGIPLIGGAANIKDGRIVVDKFTSKPTKLCSEGDLIYCVRATIGKMVIADKQYCIGRGVASFTSKINRDYLKFILQSNVKDVQTQATGSTFVQVDKKTLESIAIPLPPSKEQERIVQKIESCFEKIDATEANLKRVEILLEKYRESLLAKAFRGELISQDPSDEPASILLEKIRKERSLSKFKSSQINFSEIENDEEPSSIPNNWKWVRFGQVADVVRGGSPRPAGDPKFYNGKIPFLKVADLTNDHEIYVQGYESSIKEAGLHKTRMVQEKTLLLTNSGATLGIPKITSFETTFNDGIAAFLNVNQIDLEFLYFYLLTRTQWYLLKGAKSQGQPNLNIEIISNSVFPLPPQREQTEIVKCLKKNLVKIQTSLQNISNKKIILKKLREVILQKAFQGQLVEQIPSEGTGHELLAKILAEKEKNQKPKTIKKTKKVAVKTITSRSKKVTKKARKNNL